MWRARQLSCLLTTARRPLSPLLPSRPQRRHEALAKREMNFTFARAFAIQISCNKLAGTARPLRKPASLSLVASLKASGLRLAQDHLPSVPLTLEAPTLVIAARMRLRRREGGQLSHLGAVTSGADKEVMMIKKDSILPPETRGVSCTKAFRREQLRASTQLDKICFSQVLVRQVLVKRLLNSGVGVGGLRASSKSARTADREEKVDRLAGVGLSQDVEQQAR